MGSTTCVILYDVALIREFFLHIENYTRAQDVLDIISVLEGKGVFIVEGSQWKTQRKILSSSFNFDFLKSILGDIQDISKRTFADLDKKFLDEVDVIKVFQQMAAEVMGATFFGEKVNDYKICEGETLTQALADIMVQMGHVLRSPARFMFGTWIVKRGVLPSYARYVKKSKTFRNACIAIIEQRRKLHEASNHQTQSNKPKDMIELLLDYKGEEGKLSNERIIDEFITFYAAGTDSTSHLLGMILIQFLKNPNEGAKLLEEIQRAYRSDKPVTMDDLNKLEYVTAFVKETLRTLTPAPGIFARVAIKDHMINDLAIRKGDLVQLDFFYNHYNPKYFEDPESFKPERWLAKNPNLDAYAFTPFSAGPRNCIGQHLAMNETRVILCEFLSKYNIKLREDYKLRFDFKFMYAPVEPFVLKLTPRNK